MEAHWQFTGDLDLCHERLRGLFGRWDLVEPFERLSSVRVRLLAALGALAAGAAAWVVVILLLRPLL